MNFLVDCYLMYAASAIAANTILRSIIACGLPLAAKPMFHNLGIGPAMSILAGIATLAIPVPFLFMKYSAKLREKSKFKTPGPPPGMGGPPPGAGGGGPPVEKSGGPPMKAQTVFQGLPDEKPKLPEFMSTPSARTSMISPRGGQKRRPAQRVYGIEKKHSGQWSHLRSPRGGVRDQDTVPPSSRQPFVIDMPVSSRESFMGSPRGYPGSPLRSSTSLVESPFASQPDRGRTLT
jgi:hypothetical protein